MTNNSESEEQPPNLDFFNKGNESEDEEEPPKLECETKERMAVTRSQQNFSSSDSSLRNVTKSIRKPPRKRGSEAAAKSENSPMLNKFDEVDFDAPPALDLYGDKKSQVRASSTSSGISSIGDVHSPPSCSPLAPINGNFSRSKPTKELPTGTKTAAKRKSKTPPAPTKAKRPRRAATRKNSEPAANLELQNWIPIGKPWAEMISIGSSTTKKAVCCFPAVKHKTENVTFNILDVISVAAGEEETDGDNIGKIDRIFFDKKLGMCANVLWYYKYNQCILKDENREEIMKYYNFDERELVASKHLDTISCDSIQSHAFVLTFSEYCRYVAETKYDVLPPSFQSRCKELWPRGEDGYPRRRLLPHEDTPQDLVFFCRKYYSINRKAISSGVPLPKTTRRSKRHQKQRSVNRLLPHEDSDDSENRSQTP
uniref:BAH domain-containing protein n=1 Tax=Panagrolaimus davidi TaxID=227884 RepID=A0A914PX66_9BILA